MDKLNWINGEYIKHKNEPDLLPIVEEYLKNKDFLPPHTDKTYLGRVISLFRERLTKLSDLLDRARFCFYDNYSYSEDAKDVLSRKLAKEIKALADRLLGLADFNKEAIEKEFRATSDALGLKAKDLVHPVRVALTGKKVGPGLFETMEVLGKDKVIARLNRLVEYWESNK